MYLSDAMRKRLNNLMKENHLNTNKLALYYGMNRSNISKFLKKKIKL